MFEKFLRIIFSTFWEEFFRAASKPTQYYQGDYDATSDDYKNRSNNILDRFNGVLRSNGSGSEYEPTSSNQPKSENNSNTSTDK